MDAKNLMGLAIFLDIVVLLSSLWAYLSGGWDVYLFFVGLSLGLFIMTIVDFKS